MSTPSPIQTLPRRRTPGDVQAHLLVERVEVRLPVLVEVADVLPVAVEHVPVDRPAHLEQEREELLREVVRPVGRDVPQHLRLEHVDAGVDRVGEDLAPRRLLEEALDLAVLVGDDDPELERVVDRLEPDRDGGAGLLVRSTSAPRSTSQSASPEMTRNVSSSGCSRAGPSRPCRAAAPRPSTRCSGRATRRRRSSCGSPAA